jgi:hypothetical protein
MKTQIIPATAVFFSRLTAFVFSGELVIINQANPLDPLAPR